MVQIPSYKCIRLVKKSITPIQRTSNKIRKHRQKVFGETMKIICFSCNKEISPGDGCIEEGKQLHKKCRTKYYEWLGEMHREMIK